MESKKVNKIFVFWIILLCATGVYFSIANDTFFDLTVAKSIVENGFYNIENTTIHEGLHYNCIHWLFAIIEYFINLKMGFLGIWLFCVLGFVLYGLAIYNCSKKIGITHFTALLVTLINIILIRDYIQTRAQTFVMVFLFLAVYSLEMLYKTNKNRYIILNVICFWLIANIQSYTFVISFLIFVPYILEKIICLKKEDETEGIKFIFVNKKMKKILIALFVSFFIGLINPYGITIYYEPFVVVGGYARKMISELALSNLGNGIAVLPIIVYIMLLGYPREKIRFRDLIMLLMYIVGTLYMVKFGMYAITCTTFGTARIIDYFIKDTDKDIYNTLIINRFSKKFMFVISGIMFAIILSDISSNLLLKDLISEDAYPIEAVKYIKENIDYKNLNIYNNLNIGSYIEYNGIKCFIDSRNELFENNDKSKSIEKDEYEILYGKTSYQEIFEKYDIDYALIDKDVDIIEQAIKYDNNYEKVYDDDYYCIYIRKDIK